MNISDIPQLQRGQVWCRTCGATQRVDSAEAMRNGWPKHCGFTMTIDSPAEQQAFAEQKAFQAAQPAAPAAAPEEAK